MSNKFICFALLIRRLLKISVHMLTDLISSIYVSSLCCLEFLIYTAIKTGRDKANLVSTAGGFYASNATRILFSAFFSI